MACRIQLSRQRGARKPDTAINVARTYTDREVAEMFPGASLRRLRALGDQYGLWLRTSAQGPRWIDEEGLNLLKQAMRQCPSNSSVAAKSGTSPALSPDTPSARVLRRLTGSAPKRSDADGSASLRTRTHTAARAR